MWKPPSIQSVRCPPNFALLLARVGTHRPRWDRHLTEAPVDRAQHAPLGFVGDLVQERCHSLVSLGEGEPSVLYFLAALSRGANVAAASRHAKHAASRCERT
jgi:hypothetical protein